MAEDRMDVSKADPGRPGSRLCVWGRSAMCACLVSAAVPATAQEIALFRLTGAEGYATVRHLHDELSALQSDSPSATRSQQSQLDLRNEIFLMTHSYVYHPNFLTLDLGGGPVFQRQNFMNDAEARAAGGANYNLTGRATFLKEKPVRGALFLEHVSPAATLAADQVSQKNTRYGFDFSASGAVTPVPFDLGYARTQAQGQGIERMVDERGEEWKLKVSRSLGSLGSTQLQIQTSRQDSRSGSLSLPIQPTSSGSSGLTAETRLQLGSQQQYDLISLATFNKRNYSLGEGRLSGQKDIGFLLDLHAKHSPQLTTFGVFNYANNDQGDQLSNTHSLAAGMIYEPSAGLQTSLGARSRKQRATQYAIDSFSMDASVRYEQPLPVGTAQIGYGLRYDQRDQHAASPFVAVAGESVTLSGVAAVRLANTHVVAGSVSVSNAARTQTFVENIDFALFVAGSSTRIQRLAGGSIRNGEEVLLDYAYDLGGTFGYNQLDRTLNLSWGMSPYVNVYLRRFDSLPHVSFGAPAFPPVASRSTLVGARVDFPLKLGIALNAGGSIERESRRETTDSYWREADDLYLEADELLFGLGSIRLSSRRMLITYEQASNNVNIRGSDIRVAAKPWLGAELSAIASYERDTGGAVPSHRRDASINAVWRERKASVQATLLRSRESRGAYQRMHSVFQLTLRRDF